MKTLLQLTIIRSLSLLTYHNVNAQTNPWEKAGLFKPGITYHIEVFRFNDQLEMHIQNNEKHDEQLVCMWDVSGMPPCDEGRIGLRHMYPAFPKHLTSYQA